MPASCDCPHDLADHDFGPRWMSCRLCDCERIDWREREPQTFPRSRRMWNKVAASRDK